MSTHARRHEPPRLPDTPMAGYYIVRLVPKGPRVPAIVMQKSVVSWFTNSTVVTRQPIFWITGVCGQWMGADEDPNKVPYLLQICNYGTRITEAHYETIMRDPIIATLDPFSPVDVSALPAEEF